ncbi:MAG: inositol-3-phosphate synthase [Zavarzinella sp.]
MKNNRRVGIWLIGAWGSVATTTAVGLAAMRQEQQSRVGLVTENGWFEKLNLDQPEAFVVGGHDIHQGCFVSTAQKLHQQAGMFSGNLLTENSEILAKWTENVCPGTVLNADAKIESLSEVQSTIQCATPAEAIEKIRADITAFRTTHQLDQVVVVNTASTEPPFPTHDHLKSLSQLRARLSEKSKEVLPTSSIYAFAAIEAGCPYVNFTPSLGSSCPAIEELAREKGIPLSGQDGKTGETLLKTVLAPMFAARNLKVLSWAGFNILGGGDGFVLNDPANKATKITSKDQVLSDILGYRPQSLVGIEYVESLSDWKTAWDHIHFEGFLGTRMMMQFTWQGCDSILAAPLVIDLARLALHAQRRQEVGPLTYLASFFKSPIGTKKQNFFEQLNELWQYSQTQPANS